jgi:antitoxin YefM
MVQSSCTYHEEVHVAIETTYTHARANFKALLEEAADSREPVIIHRRGAEDVALISAEELRSLIETAHLLKSPKNGERLLRALERATSKKLRPQSVAKLRRDLGLDEE